MRRVMALLAAVRALQPAARGARRPRTRLHATKVEGPSMDQVVQLCRQRGFVFGSSEIYNGFNGFYDYGPLGCELKKNIKDLWWRDFVHGREDVHGLDSSIIASPAVWRASGHVDGFSDPMCDDKETKKRYRADQLFVGDVVDDATGITPRGSYGVGGGAGGGSPGPPRRPGRWPRRRRRGRRHGARVGGRRAGPRQGGEEALQGRAAARRLPERRRVLRGRDARVPPPGAPDRPAAWRRRGRSSPFETRVGAAADAAAAAYLRPETAQGIFVNFKNVAATARGFGVPGGVAQIGKAFRNEITPRNFVFRSREFEQMEIEYFCSDEGDAWRACHAEWVAACRAWLVDRAGLRAELLGEDVHEDLAHYARACTDITFRFPFGEQELQGIAARGCYDLTQHQEASGKSLEYVDQASGRKYVPQVVEPSIGVDRLFLAAICSAYAVDEVGGAERTLLKFSPLLAPVKAAVLPLSKKDPALLEIARRVHDDLKRRYNVQWDAAGNIGRRYRRQDEIGTPLCITVDFDSIEDGCVTVRDRDSTDQVRVKVEDVAAHVVHVIEGL